MKMVGFEDATGKTHLFSPEAIVYIGPKKVIYTEAMQHFVVIFVGGAVELTGDRDEFVRLAQKRRGVQNGARDLCGTDIHCACY